MLDADVEGMGRGRGCWGLAEGDTLKEEVLQMLYKKKDQP